MGKMKDLDIRLKCIENDITDMQIIYTQHTTTINKIVSALEKQITILELHKKDINELWNSIEEVGRIVDEICNTTK